MAKDWKKIFADEFVQGPRMKKYRETNADASLLPWFDVVEVVEATQLTKNTGRLVVRFPVQEIYLNPGGSLQGGLQAALFDVISSWVFAFADNWPGTGISRTINMSYIRPAPAGEVLLMDCELVHAGKRLGLSKGVLKRERDGAIISTCEHHKYNTAADQPKV